VFYSHQEEGLLPKDTEEEEAVSGISKVVVQKKHNEVEGKPSNKYEIP